MVGLKLIHIDWREGLLLKLDIVIYSLVPMTPQLHIWIHVQYGNAQIPYLWCDHKNCVNSSKLGQHIHLNLCIYESMCFYDLTGDNFITTWFRIGGVLNIYSYGKYLWIFQISKKCNLIFHICRRPMDANYQHGCTNIIIVLGPVTLINK